MSKKKTEDEEDELTGARNFGVMLSRVDEGDLLVDLAKEQKKFLVHLAGHADRHQKAKGKIALVLEYVVEDNGIVTIVPSYKITLPKERRPSTVFFMTKDHELGSQNERQTSLFGDGPREVGKGRAPRPGDGAREVKSDDAPAREPGTVTVSTPDGKSVTITREEFARLKADPSNLGKIRTAAAVGAEDQPDPFENDGQG